MVERSPLGGTFTTFVSRETLETMAGRGVDVSTWNVVS